MNPLVRIALAVAVVLTAASVRAPASAAEPLSVAVDQATILRLPEKVGTIVIGNPLIADVSVQAGGMLVVTGKGYGSTNLVALDRLGNVLMERAVLVSGPRDNIVVVYRGGERETYSCQPNCERRITLGDGHDYFNAVIGQTNARNAQAQGAPPPR